MLPQLLYQVRARILFYSTAKDLEKLLNSMLEPVETNPLEGNSKIVDVEAILPDRWKILKHCSYFLNLLSDDPYDQSSSESNTELALKSLGLNAENISIFDALSFLSKHPAQ
jgi:hypothetical protein